MSPTSTSDATPRKCSAYWTRCRRMSCARATGSRARKLCKPPERDVFDNSGPAATCCRTATEDQMSITLDTIRDALPDYARDLKLNLGTVLTTAGAPGLSEKQIWGIALASAIASRNVAFARDVESLAAAHLDAPYLSGARAAAAIMGMNNIYY